MTKLKPTSHPALDGFAMDLRALRVRAGKPDFKEMGKATALGRTVLSQTLNGKSVPTWPVTEALVVALGGDVDEWRRRWASMANAVNSGIEPRATRGVTPRQLPGSIGHFVGRHRELDILAAQLEQAVNGGCSGAITSIGGTAGIGKTSLALYFARRNMDRFPDGQLYINLQGFDPTGKPRAPAEAIRCLLDAFDIPVGDIPATQAEMEAFYRSIVGDKRVLILLDNARDSDQVRPLLPGSSNSLVLVTSRQLLTGLVARDHASHIQLDLFSAEEAYELLTKILGNPPATAEAHAVHELIERCARLPLAVSIAASRVVTNAKLSLGTLVGELRQERQRLRTLATGDGTDTDICAVFSWSYKALSTDAARLFRLMGLHVGNYISVPAAASLAGQPASTVQTLLAELTQASLLDRRSDGRFEVHDLLRAYAVQLIEIEDQADERRQATLRLQDHYLQSSYAGSLLLLPHREPLRLPMRQPGVTLHDLADKEQALAWFADERLTLLATIRSAAENGLDEHCWRLAEACSDFLDRQGHWHSWLTAQTVALKSAQRLAEPYGQACVHRDLGLARTRLGDLNEAYGHFQDAIRLFGDHGEPAGQARALTHLSWLLESDGRIQEALGCAEKALDLFTAANHQVGQAAALDTAASYHILLGDYQHALTKGQAALGLFQDLSDGYGEASALDNIGSARHHLGQHREAIVSFRQALRLCRDAADRYGSTVILTHLGDTCHDMGDADAARDAWSESLNILDELGHLDADGLRIKLQRLGDL